MRIRSMILLFLVMNAALAFGGDAKDIEKRLNDRLANGIVVLRAPRAGKTLKFDLDGQTKDREGIRGFDDKVEIKSVQLRGEKLILKGVRLHDVYDPKAKKISLASVNEPFEADLLLSNPGNEGSITADYYKVFLPNAELAKRSCTDFGYFAKSFERAGKDTNVLDVRDSKPKPRESREVCFPSGSKGWTIGNEPGTVFARPIKDPDPDYPDLERAARKQGGADFVIRVDENGRITDGVLLRTDSVGFVQKSTEVLNRWRFKPGEKGGSPVPSVLMVEVHFHLTR